MNISGLSRNALNGGNDTMCGLHFNADRWSQHTTTPAPSGSSTAMTFSAAGARPGLLWSSDRPGHARSNTGTSSNPLDWRCGL